MTADEMRLREEIGGANRFRPEAQMRHCHRAGLLRVVNEVTLGVVVCVLPDDFDALLVRAHGAVGTETVEQSSECLAALNAERLVVVETRL